MELVHGRKLTSPALWPNTLRPAGGPSAPTARSSAGRSRKLVQHMKDRSAFISITRRSLVIERVKTIYLTSEDPEADPPPDGARISHD